jgi:methyltransferase family protein
MDAAPDGAEIILIDWHSVATPEYFQKWKSYLKPNQKSSLYYDSQDPATLESVKNELAGRQLDFLWIDADHHFENIDREYNWYGALVREGGLIGVHDTRAIGAEYRQCGEWWQQFSKIHEVEEIVASENPCGTGLYYKIKST